MSGPDNLILAALIATVWLNLYLSADRIVSDARVRTGRPGAASLLRWVRVRIAALVKGGRDRRR